MNGKQIKRIKEMADFNMKNNGLVIAHLEEAKEKLQDDNKFEEYKILLFEDIVRNAKKTYKNNKKKGKHYNGY